MLRFALLAMALMSTAAAAANESEEPHPGAAAFVDRVVAEYGLDPEKVQDVLGDATYQQSIIDAITRPAEGKPWHEYRKIFITPTRVSSGVEFWRANADLLAEISDRFGVPTEVMVAIVGVETSYGLNTGSYRVIDALATLGFYYPKRGEFFADELGQFLRLAEEESLPVTEIRGSYAGAMGVGQFIPSSYRAYAVDMDETGKRDLWRSLPDAMGSVANYLATHGWRADEPIALPAELSGEPPQKDFSLKPAHTLDELATMGVQFDAGDLPGDTEATLIELEQAEGQEYWVGLNNFYVITRYNRSPLYAMAVTQLAGEIREQRQ
ncbi:lytic murein transglycosylase B [Wenzhouxiangella sp. EGI_FJ10305]|uniref:lytic murein transglycosylase B n=1 Tax=Wenzhouxiangella sp. EGI_FJ10305 TaxID=3243768 RepID=UPI0035DC5F05